MKGVLNFGGNGKMLNDIKSFYVKEGEGLTGLI